MSIRKHPIAYLALFIALGGTSYAATHRSASPGCYPKGGRPRTIAQDKAGRFYVSGGFDNSGPLTWYVCSFKQGTPRKLQGTQPSAGHTPFGPSAKAFGRYVAFVFFGPTGFCSSSGGRPPSEVWVIDMVTGQRTFSERLTGAESFPVPRDALVLKPDGFVAWVTSDSCSGTTTLSINRHDSTGTATVDSGPRIDPHSLAAGGQWLYWTNAGSPRSAPFH